jgi:hypothetical protein
LHDAVLLGALIFGISADDERHPIHHLPSAANDLATRSDPELGGECNSAAGHQLQHSVKHTRLRAARCLFLPVIAYDPSYSSTVLCVPDCIKSIQRKSSSRRAACDV